MQQTEYLSTQCNLRTLLELFKDVIRAISAEMLYMACTKMAVYKLSGKQKCPVIAKVELIVSLEAIRI